MESLKGLKNYQRPHCIPQSSDLVVLVWCVDIGACTCVYIFTSANDSNTWPGCSTSTLEETTVIWEGQGGGGSPGENRKGAKKKTRNVIVSEKGKIKTRTNIFHKKESKDL